MTSKIKRALYLSFPVFLGYVFLGIAFGVLLSKAGYNTFIAFISSLLIYGGSIQFALIAFFKDNTPLFTIIFMTLLINSRQIFYGISLLKEYADMGKFKPYMIFSLTDETYALVVGLKDKEDKLTLFFISLFNHLYWIFGSVLGSIIGNVLNFNSKGIDFAMTALFVTIMVEQYENYKDHFAFYTGLFCGVVCLLIFKPDNFIFPALISTVAILLWRKKK